MSTIVSGRYFDFSWYLGLDRSIRISFEIHIYMLMNSPYEVRFILVYTYEYFCNFFVQFNKKNTIAPPPFNSQNKTSPDVQRRKSFCREIRHIYIHTVCAPRAESQGGVLFIVCSRLYEPQWPSKIRRHRHFRGVLVLVIYHLMALVELLAAILRVRTQEGVCGPKRQYSYV